MTDVLSNVFVKKIVAEEKLPRSGRQITRDISSAIRNRNTQLLECFQLRTLDDHILPATEIVEIGIVKKLLAEGKGPEWYVDLENYREILKRRSRKNRPKSSQPPSPTERPVDELETETQRPNGGSENSTDTATKQHDYLEDLLNEKDHRINELKESKIYLENILQKLIGKDTLKALASIVENESVDSEQLVSLITSASDDSSSASTAKEVALGDTQHSTEPAERKPEGKTEIIDVVVSDTKDASVKKQLARSTKKSASQKLRQKSATKKPTKKAKKKPANEPAPKWYDMPTINRFLSRKR